MHISQVHLKKTQVMKSLSLSVSDVESPESHFLLKEGLEAGCMVGCDCNLYFTRFRCALSHTPLLLWILASQKRVVTTSQTASSQVQKHGTVSAVCHPACAVTFFVFEE